MMGEVEDQPCERATNPQSHRAMQVWFFLDWYHPTDFITDMAVARCVEE